MADRTLNLGTLFTGAVDATFTRAVESVEGLVARLEGAVAKANAAAAGMAKGVAGVGPAITPLQKYIGELQQTLAHSPVAMNKAADAATKLAKKYGDSAISIKAWRGSLDGVIQSVEAVRQRMIAAGKAGDAYANSINYRALAEGVIAKKIAATAQGFVSVVSQTKRATASQAAAGKAADGLATKYGKTKPKLSDYEKALKRAETETVGFNAELSETSGYLGRQGTALRVSESLAKKFERAIQTTALRLKDSGVNATIFAESLDRSAIREAWFNRQLSITEKGLVLRNTATARGIGLNAEFASKMGLVVPNARLLNAQYALQSKLMAEVGSRGENFRRAVLSLGQMFGTSNYQVKQWGTSLRKTADSIEITRQRMIAAGKNGNAFAASVNVGTLAARVQNNQLLATSKGFRQVSTAAEKVAQDISKIPPAMKGGTIAYEAMKRGISQVSVAVGEASAETIRYKSALTQLARQHAPATIGFDALKSTLNKVERSIQITAYRMNDLGKKGTLFAASANRVAMVNNVLHSQIKAVSTGFVSLKKTTTAAMPPMNEYVKLIGKVSGESTRYKAALFQLARELGTNTIKYQQSKAALNQVERAIYATSEKIKAAGHDGEVYSRSVDRMALVHQVLTGQLRATSTGFKIVAQSSDEALTAVAKGSTRTIMSLSMFEKMQKKAAGRTQEFKDYLYASTVGLKNYDGHVEAAAKIAFKLDDALIRTGLHLKNSGVNAELFQANINRAALEAEFLAGRVQVTARGLQIYSAESTTAARATARAIGVNADFAKKMGLISAATKNTFAHLTEYRKIIDDVKNKGKEYLPTVLKMAEAHGRSGKSTKLWGNALLTTIDAIDTTRAKMNAAGKDGDKWAKSRDVAGIAERVFAKHLKYTDEGFKAINVSAANAVSGVRNFGNQTNFVGKQISRVHGGINRLMAAMSVVANYAIAAQGMFLIVNAVKETILSVARFDQVLKDLQAVTGDTDDAIRVIGNTIKETSDKFVYNADQMSEAARNLAQAGFSAEETLEALPSVAVLATTTMEGMRIAADLLTTTIRAFELNTMESARVADVFAIAANKSKLTIDGLRIVMNYLGPVAHEAGMSLESTAAATMVLADSGIRMSTIGTGLRQVLARLIAPTSAMRAEFEKSGIDISKLNPMTSDFIDVLRELSLGVKDAGAAFRLFGLRGASVAIALINSFRSGSFKEAIDNVYKVGTASIMAAKQMEGIEARAQNLAAKFKLLMIAAGEGGLKSAMSLVVDVLRTAVTAMNEFVSTTTGKMIIGITAWTVTIYGLAKAGQILIEVVKRLGIAMLGLNFSNMILEWTIVTGWVAKAEVVFVHLWRAIKAHPFFMLSAVIGAIVVGMNIFNDSINASVRVWEDYVKGIDSNITKLEFFKTKLAELSGKVGTSEESTMAYTAALQRLAIEFPKLAGSINGTASSWSKLNAELDTAISSENQRRLQALAALTLQYTLQAEQASKPTSTWSWAISGMIQSAKEVYTLFRHGREAAEDMNQMKHATEKANAKIAEMGLQSKEAEQALLNLRKAASNLVPDMKAAGISAESSAEDIEGALWAMGMTGNLTIAQTKALSQSLKKHWTDIESYAQKAADGTAALSIELPKNYLKMATKLDHLRQVELINAGIALDKELDAFRKNATAMNLSEEQKWAVIESIRHKHLTKFIEDANKEVITTQQMALLKEAVYAQELAQIQHDYDARYNIIYNAYQAEIREAGESAAKRAEADKRYAKLVEGLNDENNARTEAAAKEHNDFLIKLYEGYIQRYQERTDLLLNLHQELYKAKQDIAEEHYKWDLAALDRNLAKRKAAIEAMAIPENKRTELLKRAEEDYWNASIRLAQKSARERIGLLEEEVAREKQIINNRYGDAVKLERDRIKAIEDATGKRLENADREVAAEREKDQKILAVEIKLRDQKIKIYGETLASFEKYIDDQIKEQERLASELKRINGEIRDSEREKMEDIRDIKRMEMNEAQKLQDTKAAFQREMQAGEAALAAGDTTEALAAAKRAISLNKERSREAKSLNDEIKSKQKEYADAVADVSKAEERSTGKSKKSYRERSDAIQEAQDKANAARTDLLALGGTVDNEAALIQGATDAWGLYGRALDKTKQDTQSAMDTVGNDIASKTVEAKKLKDNIDALTQQKIQLETGLIPMQIKEVEASLADLKTRLEDIKAKIKIEVIFPENLTQEISETVDGSIRDVLGGKDAAEIPIAPKVDMSSAKTEIDGFIGGLQQDPAPKLTIDITATGSTEAPITEKLQEIENKIWELQAIITSGASKMTFDIATPEGRGATEVINEVLASLQNLAASLGTVNLTEMITGADAVIDQLNQITELVRDLIALDATINLNVPMGEYIREMLYDILQTLQVTVAKIWTVAIHVKGLDDLINAKNYIDSLRNKTVYVDVVTRQTSGASSGRSTGTTSSSPDIVEGSPDKFDWWESRMGGQAPISSDVTELLAGFGGGDKIKALLEPGEFIIRKEAVQKYGSKLFSALNAMRLATGGYTFDFLNTAKKAGSEATSLKAGLSTVAGAETLQKIRSRIQEYVGATLGKFAKSPQAFTQTIFNAVKNVMSGQYAEISLSTQPARVSSMSGYDSGFDMMRKAMGGIVGAVGKIPSHVSAQRLSTGGMAMPKKARTEESLVVRFQIGDQEYPVAVQDMGSKSMIKQFSRELSKARLTSAR